MNKTALRLYMVAAIVAATIGISYLVGWATEPPPVEMPSWTLNALPPQFGDWHGEDTKMDPLVAVSIGTKIVVNRKYRDQNGHEALLHGAMFNDPAAGVYHSPLNCYLTAGWKLVSNVRENVDVADDLNISVAVTTWEKENEKILVIYWYELGRHVLYSRFDLGTLRVTAMRGQPKWPTLIKVMVQAPLTDSENSKTVALEFVQRVAKWLNRPEHRKYLDQWPAT